MPICLHDPKPTNDRMRQMNPSMDAETFAEAAEAQKPFVETVETRRDGLGTMTRQRWATLIQQWKDLGDIPQAMPAEECFWL
jgi:NitT/TauT family transport system substrate-binding protein